MFYHNTVEIQKTVINFRPVIIGIVVGEVSGDILGSELIKSLKKKIKMISFFGIGGSRMRFENMECWYDISELSTMGIVEIILKVPYLLKIRREIFHKFLILKPDIFIGIDFPDFNIFLEKRLKKKGIKTVHYVSPSVWAWRSNRVLALKQAIDHILVLFPFEKLIYDKYNIPCQVVGHVLADIIPLNPDKEDMRRKLNISKEKKCLVLLPGSRITEVKMLTYDFLNSAKLLSKQISNLEILVVLNDKKLIDLFMKLSDSIAVTFRIFNTQNPWEIMVASDVALLASGTATLECMLSKCPMVVAYRMHPITFLLIKKLIKIPWISLPNLLFNGNLVQEFIQKDCNPKKLTAALYKLLNYNDVQMKKLQQEFYMLHKSIQLNSSEKIADILLKKI